MLSIADLNASKKCEIAFEFEFIDEQGAQTGLFISVLGDQASSVKKAIYAKINRERTQNAVIEKRGKDVPIKPIEELIGDNIEGVAACIVGWRGIVEEYSPELAFTICENNRLIVEQVKAASENLANF